MYGDQCNNKEKSYQELEAICIFYNGSQVTIDWDTQTQQISPIVRICSVTPQNYLLLSQSNSLYSGIFDEKRLTIHLSCKRNDVVDVQYGREDQKLYIVTKSGAVLTQTIKDNKDIASNDLWLPVMFDPLELSEEGIHISRVCCSSSGAIFVSSVGDIYALGSCGVHFSVECDQPKMVRLFKNTMEIIDLMAGDKFFVFLARKEGDQVQPPNEYGGLPDLVSSEMYHKNDKGSASSLNSSMSNCNLETNIQSLLQQGHSLLHTEVFTMGSVNRGLLGTGDHIKRETILTVQKLREIGVCSLSCGRDHTVVRTIDGRLYHWGLNTQQQLTESSNVHELSSPTELSFDSSDLDVPRVHILEACCGDYRTALLNTQGEIHDKDKQLIYREREFITLQMKNATKQSYPLLIASSNLTIYNRRLFKRQFHLLHHHLQTQLQTMMSYRRRFHQLNKWIEKAALKDLRHVCQRWENILYLVIGIFNSLEIFYRGDIDESSQLVVIKYYRECTKIFEAYAKAYCDIYSIDGFNEAQQMFQQLVTATPVATSSAPMYNADKNLDILKMFQHPFQFVPYVIQLLEQIQKCDNTCREELSAWMELARHNRIDLELADNTRDFWRSCHKNTKIIHFKRKERRVILSSSAVPIKLSHSMGLTTPTFVLFSDYLCQVVNHITPYPLDAVWLKKEDSGIRIITPEKNFLLIARNQHGKELWYDQLECSIKNILNLPENSKIPEVRSIEYHFKSNNSPYADVYAKGNFSNGAMHGKCRLEFPNGKIYAGDVIHGVIEGYGQMFQPKVGLYKGHFKNGMFDGYGTLIISEKEIYEGNFRNGHFSGHGHMQHPDYVYVGNFEDNLKCGYGVFDRLASGEKYLGIFADNKRIGSGICITAGGDYFEGSFANDELTGKCVTIFPNQFYYEGEASLAGPNGSGKYFMPATESLQTEKENNLSNANWENNLVTGTILAGNLSGSWESIRINGTGSVDINAKFPKYPSSLGSHVINNTQKWCSLFDNFESELFGDLTKAMPNTKALTFALWNRVIAFINKQQQIESGNMIPRELDISKAMTPSTMGGGKRTLWPLHNSSVDVDKLSLNLSLFSFDKLELSKLHSQSEDTITGLDFSNFDLLSNFNKRTQANIDDNHGNHTFSNLLSVMEHCNATPMDSFNDSALSGSDLMNECIALQTEMDLIPQFGFGELTEKDLAAIKEYLKNAFRYCYHPFKHINERITYAFYRSYGCWKIKPTALLAKQAMREWESISQRVYKFIRRLFPALPEEYAIVGERREVVSHITLLYPILLSEGIYSTLFVLYANKYSLKDELYRQHLLQAEKLNDAELVQYLEFESDILAVVATDKFGNAVQLLKELKEKYSPMAMLTVIENCMEQLTHAYQQISKANQTSLSADIIMPLTLVLLLRAGIHHLGAELALLDDLTDSNNFQFEMNGIRGYCYTTLKASYEHIASKSLFEKNTF